MDFSDLVQFSELNAHSYQLGPFNDNELDFFLTEMKWWVECKEHIHNDSISHLFFIDGEGILKLDGKEHQYQKGSYYKLEKKVFHWFKTKTDTRILSMQYPSLVKEDGSFDIEF